MITILVSQLDQNDLIIVNKNLHLCRENFQDVVRNLE